MSTHSQRTMRFVSLLRFPKTPHSLLASLTVQLPLLVLVQQILKKLLPMIADSHYQNPVSCIPYLNPMETGPKKSTFRKQFRISVLKAKISDLNVQISHIAHPSPFLAHRREG